MESSIYLISLQGVDDYTRALTVEADGITDEHLVNAMRNMFISFSLEKEVRKRIDLTRENACDSCPLEKDDTICGDLISVQYCPLCGKKLT